MSVDTTTGEIVPVNKSSAASVVGYLEHARTWLATAVEVTGPAEIAMAKAQIATAAEATKQLNLSKEIQLDAVEMVRRAEYALGKSIRRGQTEGTVAKRGDVGSGFVGPSRSSRGDDLERPGDLVPNLNERADLYAMADAGDDGFDAALSEAKAEGNLSRANVARKVKKQASPVTRDQRADLIEDLAAQGYTSRQMPAKVGVTEETVRKIAREYDIEIPADKTVGRTRRINSTHVVVNTATALEGLVSGVELIDYDALDLAEVGQWVTSLTDSMRTLNRFVKQIKEVTQ